MEKIKELWKRFIKLTESNVFLWSYPLFVIAFLSVTPPRLLGFLFLVIWGIAVYHNVDDEKI